VCAKANTSTGLSRWSSLTSVPSGQGGASRIDTRQADAHARAQEVLVVRVDAVEALGLRGQQMYRVE
jgi:hypothetical protein